MADEGPAPRRLRLALAPRGWRAWLRAMLLIFGIIGLIAGIVTYMVAMPGALHRGPLPDLDEARSHTRDRLERLVTTLAVDIGPRNHGQQAAYDRAAALLEGELKALGFSVRRQEYPLQTHSAVNIVAELPGTSRADEVIVVGGHYDSVYGCPGANDNASGAAGTIEVARLIGATPRARSLRFVLFANEEPPFFKTHLMGSAVYARSCKEAGDKVVAMLSLETIGCYLDEPGSQQYPPPFNRFYPDTGNFIGVVGNLSSRSLVRRCVGVFRASEAFPCDGVAAPASIQGIDWSDHWSFWQEGYPAVMITDTAPFRYDHYHEPSDTPDKLDFGRMARVIHGVAAIVEDLADKP